MSRQLSQGCIHVERIIGVIRQYTILQSTLPINSIMCPETQEISVIDKVVTVCCALCNCCNSIVSFDLSTNHACIIIFGEVLLMPIM